MFRFTIRDVLWLMVVVAVLLAWLAENRLTAQKHAAELQMKNKYSWRDIWAIDAALEKEGYELATTDDGQPKLFKIEAKSNDKRRPTDSDHDPVLRVNKR